jgi:hypothetical protein
MLDLPVWLIACVLGVGCIIIAILLYILIKTNGKSDVYINKNGVVVKAASPKNITTKQFINFMKEIISYVEDSKENYVDDVIGIKNLYFKQSKDFAKSRIVEVQNAIIEEYKMEYMKKYSGRLHPSLTKDGREIIIDATVLLPTANQLDENKTEKGETKPVSPCHRLCASGCNSGLSFFESHLQKDFKPILEEVFRIIEENHLVNRLDREYEEEIVTKAGQLSSYLKNCVISYPVPIDNEIAKEVIYRKTPEVQDAIEDSLRRSRTLSKEKREHIQSEKEKYYRKRDTKISQIVNILNDSDLEAILRRTDRRITDGNDMLPLS